MFQQQCQLLASDETLQHIDQHNHNILLVLIRLKVNKTAWPDKFYPRAIKEAKSEIVEHLTVLSSKSFLTWKTPENQKFSSVMLLKKKIGPSSGVVVTQSA